jgi:hypothetical protein
MATCEECEKEDHINCANAWTWDDICECKCMALGNGKHSDSKHIAYDIY